MTNNEPDYDDNLFFDPEEGSISAIEQKIDDLEERKEKLLLKAQKDFMRLLKVNSVYLNKGSISADKRVLITNISGNFVSGLCDDGSIYINEFKNLHLVLIKDFSSFLSAVKSKEFDFKLIREGLKK